MKSKSKTLAHRRIVFVTSKYEKITEAIRKIDEDVRGWTETYYENGWLCDRCGMFYAQRLEPKKCWQCEENSKQGMSTSPGTDFLPI